MSKFLPKNEQIRVPEVRVVDENGTQLGVMRSMDARRAAEEKGLDLILVAPNASPPVCKFGDYGKYLYAQSKKDKEARKASKAGALKEFKLTPKIGKHDLDVRVKRASEFLAKRHKVKFTLSFRGREMAHTDLGRELLNNIKIQLAEVGLPEEAIKQEGKRFVLIFGPKS